MTFWDWAVRAYDDPAVAETCLALQDAHAQNVPLLLWAAWLAREGREADIAAGAALARRWEVEVVGPIRSARRALRQAHPPVADTARETLRDRIKAVELQAEGTLMEALADLSSPGPPRDLRETLSQAARAWNGGAPEAALDRLAASL